MTYFDESVSQEPPSLIPGPSCTVAVYAIVFEGEVPALDNGALHGRAHIERGIRYVEAPDAAGRGQLVSVAFVGTSGVDSGAPYHGVVAGEFWIDRATGTGHKDLAAHTNAICEVARGKIQLAGLSVAKRRALAVLLESLSPAGWAVTPSMLKLFLAV